MGCNALLAGRSDQGVGIPKCQGSRHIRPRSCCKSDSVLQASRLEEQQEGRFIPSVCGLLEQNVCFWRQRVCVLRITFGPIYLHLLFRHDDLLINLWSADVNAVLWLMTFTSPDVPCLRKTTSGIPVLRFRNQFCFCPIQLCV